jgi:hypothetical protein
MGAFLSGWTNLLCVVVQPISYNTNNRLHIYVAYCGQNKVGNLLSCDLVTHEFYCNNFVSSLN